MILKNKFLTENKSMKSFLENMNMSSSKDSKVNLTILALLFVVGFTIFFWIIGSQK